MQTLFDWASEQEANRAAAEQVARDQQRLASLIRQQQALVGQGEYGEARKLNAQIRRLRAKLALSH